jgi:hypothetical protein
MFRHDGAGGICFTVRPVTQSGFAGTGNLVAAAHAPHEAPERRADRRGREPQTEQHARVRLAPRESSRTEPRIREPQRHQREAESKKDGLEAMHAAERLRRRKDSVS